VAWQPAKWNFVDRECAHYTIAACLFLVALQVVASRPLRGCNRSRIFAGALAMSHFSTLLRAIVGLKPSTKGVDYA
jgi:hypothetical protein